MRFTIFVAILLLLASCRKERYTTSSAVQLATSADSLRFDTVFTTTGSITQTLKLFNTASEGISISAVRLAGGAASPFKLNCNGTPGPLVETINLAAGDSAYVFVTASIPETAAAAPFVVQDSIEISYNGNKKIIQLEAYGQNAHFYRNGHISGNAVWNNDLPYVLLGAFTIEQGAHLTITNGCKIYLHADAPFVVEGQLTVQGDHWDSARVVFTSDRLDAPYRDLPGSWPGLFFKATSHDNSLQYGVLKNATTALAVEASPLANKLHVSETVIDNAYDAGLVASNATVEAQNLLISNCGRNLVLRGGTYTFTHATIASFSNAYLLHKAPVATISNAAGNGSASALNAVFRNCIFWGESELVPTELVVEQSEAAAFHLSFDGVLWPLASPPEEANVTTAPIISDPEFQLLDAEKKIYDFHLKESSPARNSGVPTSVSLDLDGRPRPALAPDLGAYQNQ